MGISGNSSANKYIDVSLGKSMSDSTRRKEDLTKKHMQRKFLKGHSSNADKVITLMQNKDKGLSEASFDEVVDKPIISNKNPADSGYSDIKITKLVEINGSTTNKLTDLFVENFSKHPDYLNIQLCTGFTYFPRRRRRSALHHKYILRKSTTDGQFQGTQLFIRKFKNKNYLSEDDVQLPTWIEQHNTDNAANMNQPFSTNRNTIFNNSRSNENIINKTKSISPLLHLKPEWFRSETTGSVRRSVSKEPASIGFAVRQPKITPGNLSNIMEAGNVPPEATGSSAMEPLAPDTADDHRLRHKISRAIRGKFENVCIQNITPIYQSTINVNIKTVC